jgi:hypothetical protein
LACLAALAGGAPALRSQQSEFGPYKFDLKVRLGFYGGDLQQTKFDNKIIGFGFQARREIFGPGTAIAAELTWEHIPSRWQDITDYVKHNQYNVSPIDGNTAPLNEFDGENEVLLKLHPYYSMDARKEAARGFSLVVSYHSKLPSGLGWKPLDDALDSTNWYAGLRFDRYKVFSEFRWRLRKQNLPVLPPPASLPADNANNMPVYPGGQGAFHEEGNSLAPGIVAGLRHTINDSFAFECGLRYFGTKHWDMTPGAYFKENRTQYRMETGTSYGIGIEFALVCKL